MRGIISSPPKNGLRHFAVTFSYGGTSGEVCCGSAVAMLWLCCAGRPVVGVTCALFPIPNRFPLGWQGPPRPHRRWPSTGFRRISSAASTRGTVAVPPTFDTTPHRRVVGDLRTNLLAAFVRRLCLSGSGLVGSPSPPHRPTACFPAFPPCPYPPRALTPPHAHTFPPSMGWEMNNQAADDDRGVLYVPEWAQAEPR